MTENVYRPSRRVNGRRVRARLYSGRYSLGRGERVVTVALHTPDELVARKRLREIVVAQQRQAEGLAVAPSLSDAAKRALPELVEEYRASLASRELAPRHVHDTTARIARILREAGWQTLRDVTLQSFERWRASLTCSAKTKKEYQTSMVAFLNWLVRVECLERNPLAKVTKVETRGKGVRHARAFTEEELARLFAVSGQRAAAYKLLVYTGQRKSEVRALTWPNVHLDVEIPFVRFDASATKDKEARVVPLHRVALDVLRGLAVVERAATVLHGRFPTFESFRRDLVAARIEREDAAGRVVHFHSFRKTFQTLGVKYGINQRSAQELLGHSDANLTAKAYTDVASLSMQAEVSKLPSIGDSRNVVTAGDHDAQLRALKLLILRVFDGLLRDVTGVAKHVFAEGKGASDALRKMVVGTGFEPV